ncbi:hypothetical protein, partial [Petrachloros mirabilis]
MSEEVRGTVSGISGTALARQPSAVLAAMGILGATTFLLDLWADPSVDIPILYLLVVLLSVFSSSDRIPFLSGLGSIVLTFIPPLFYWPSPLDWWVFLNRGIAAAAIAVTMLLVSDRRRAAARERNSSDFLAKTVEERTAELHAINQALESEIALRRRAEASFVESQNRLAKTQEFTAVMVTHVALDGRWLKVPPSLCKLL